MKTIIATMLAAAILTLSFTVFASTDKQKAIHDYCTSEAMVGAEIVAARDAGVAVTDVYNAVNENMDNPALLQVVLEVYSNPDFTKEAVANVVYVACTKKLYETYQIEESGV